MLEKKPFHESVVERIERECDIALSTFVTLEGSRSVLILCSLCELISDTFIPQEYRKELAGKLNLYADRLSGDLSRNKTVNILRNTARIVDV